MKIKLESNLRPYLSLDLLEEFQNKATSQQRREDIIAIAKSVQKSYPVPFTLTKRKVYKSDSQHNLIKDQQEKV